MAHKFPSTVKVNYKPFRRVGAVGYSWSVTDADGASLLAEGETCGAKREASADAWHTLEQMGLVIDE